MRTITIRDLRQRWPATEKALRVEGEMLITRDGQPVAKLVRLTQTKPQAKQQRKRWDPKEHMRWLKRIWDNKQVRLVDKYLAIDRADRWV